MAPPESKNDDDSGSFVFNPTDLELKLSCPQCGTNSTVQLKKPLDHAVMATCNKCGEKFSVSPNKRDNYRKDLDEIGSICLKAGHQSKKDGPKIEMRTLDISSGGMKIVLTHRDYKMGHFEKSDRVVLAFPVPKGDKETVVSIDAEVMSVVENAETHGVKIGLQFYELDFYEQKVINFFLW